jgi:hypothetical protein
VTLDDRLDISSDVVSREIGGETMLLDLASGTYFGLDEVGGVIWAVLEGGGSLIEARDRVEQQFDAPRQVVEADLLALASRLVEQGLASLGNRSA